MRFSKQDSTQKNISAPTLVSSFVGMMAAVPLAFALSGPINTSAVQQTGQEALSQANVEDFAKFAYAFNQGYEAKATSSTSSGGGQPVSCSEASVSTGGSGGGGHEAVATSVAYNNKPSYKHGSHVGGKGGGAHMPKLSGRAAAMMNSYNTYMSKIYNSSTVNNVNSNNTVGSHNSMETKIEVDDSKGVIVGVSNDSTSVQNNANESFNKDSYNTKTETNTTIVNDSFNKDITNTTTNTTNTDIDVHKETNVTNTENSYNTDNSNSGNNSNNSLDVDVKANVDVNSHNETNIQPPVIHQEPTAVVEELPVTEEVPAAV